LDAFRTEFVRKIRTNFARFFEITLDFGQILS
jgi:hypothetical protein